VTVICHVTVVITWIESLLDSKTFFQRNVATWVLLYIISHFSTLYFVSSSHPAHSSLLLLPPNVRGSMSRMWKAPPGRRVCCPSISITLSPFSPSHSKTYCSEDCQNIDSSSPSMSSASSALSSPHLDGTIGGDVPPLMPSALGSALRKYTHSRNHRSVSSSASSASWSVCTDDDHDGSALATPYESGFHDSVDSLYEGSSKSAQVYSTKQSALSYARRPSGTNNRSTVPQLHKRTSSEHVHGPRSAPLQSYLSTDDDGISSDFGFSSRDESDTEFHPTKAASSKPKRNRNRASLPSYFSLLQMTSPSTEKQPPPIASSPGHTIARPSPPTPKLPLTALATGLSRSTSTVITGSIHSTPRGRRRVPADFRASSGSSSRSRSRSRTFSRKVPESSPQCMRSRLDSRASVEQVFDWSSMPEPPRGRPAVRRNSSPPPKMLLSAVALQGHCCASANDEALGPACRKYRGRMRLEGFPDAGAPGLGLGRSGLLDRERRAPHLL
jgi:hypothetical protein